jgi:hypothetical protein
MKVTEAMVEQRHTFEMLCEKIDDLVDALNHKVPRSGIPQGGK